MGKRLKLRAEDVEDLQVLSACLQDAVMRLEDTIYDARRRRFAMMVNRFRWEGRRKGRIKPSDRRRGERVRAGVHFDGVLDVKALGIPQGDPDHVLDLLAIDWKADESGGGEVTLLLAGGGAIRLTVECIEAELSDIGEPWYAKRTPAHPTDAD